jgi:hypothetical protein
VTPAGALHGQVGRMRPMTRTPLHVALGDDGDHLGFSHIERACAEGITERFDLDWKKTLPLTAPDKEGKAQQQAELAKDIAAMANSGGGLIVYGVQQTGVGSESHAEKIVPVGIIGEAELKTVRQVAGALIYPPVSRLQFFHLFPPGAPGEGVLAMSVPDSIDAPHLVNARSGQHWFGVPWRDGPDTAWMVERQIADSYFRREVERRRQRTTLKEFFEGFSNRCLGTGGQATWVMAVAVPERPYRGSRAVTLGRADRLFSLSRAIDLPSGVGARYWTQIDGAQTRRGLRSFHQLVRSASGGPFSARLEIHADGALAVGLTRGEWEMQAGVPRTAVAISDLEQAGLDLTSLMLAWVINLGGSSNYSFRLNVAPSTQIFVRADSAMRQYFVPFTEDQRVPNFMAVDGTIIATEGSEPLLRSAVELIGDAVNQTGAATALSADALATQLALGH